MTDGVCLLQPHRALEVCFDCNSARLLPYVSPHTAELYTAC